MKENKEMIKKLGEEESKVVSATERL